MNIYLAGKIEKNDWRHEIFRNLRNSQYYRGNGNFKDKMTVDGFLYNGPYFLSCDHGCYHGPNNHGRGVVTAGCGEVGDRSRDVLNKCLQWIETSDIVFVWLDSTDAYGTISEIGYAKALKKPIFIAMDEKFMNRPFSKDTWFIQTMSNWFTFAKNAYEAWGKFLEMKKEKEGQPFSYVYDEANLRWIRTKTSEYCNRIAYKHSVEELNALDRMQLAQDFKESHSLQYRFKEILDNEEFLLDIAKELDYKIVRGFLKNTTQQEAKNLKSWSIEGTGLIYKFQENYEREKKADGKPKPTEKQLGFLLSLLTQNKKQLAVNKDDLTMQQASWIISHFTKNIELPKEADGLIKKKGEMYSATEVVHKLRTELKVPWRTSITMGTHTKCLHYFEDHGLITYEDNEYVHYVKLRGDDPMYFQRFYTSKWCELLTQTLSVEEKFEEIKKYRRQKQL